MSLLPIVADLAERYPKVDFVISEYEPIEAFALLTNDDLDLALTYDYNLAPASPSPVLGDRCHCGRSRGDSAFPPTPRRVCRHRRLRRPDVDCQLPQYS